jgi:hypothetical protein
MHYSTTNKNPRKVPGYPFKTTQKALLFHGPLCFVCLPNRAGIPPTLSETVMLFSSKTLIFLSTGFIVASVCESFVKSVCNS